MYKINTHSREDTMRIALYRSLRVIQTQELQKLHRLEILRYSIEEAESRLHIRASLRKGGDHT